MYVLPLPLIKKSNNKFQKDGQKTLSNTVEIKKNKIKKVKKIGRKQKKRDGFGDKSASLSVL